MRWPVSARCHSPDKLPFTTLPSGKARPRAGSNHSALVPQKMSLIRDERVIKQAKFRCFYLW